MQVRFPEIDHPLAGPVFHIGVPDIPFLRHGPVENRSPRRNLVNFKRNMTTNHSEGLAKTRTRDAATEGIHLTDERMHPLTHLLPVDRSPPKIDIHSFGLHVDQ